MRGLVQKCWIGGFVLLVYALGCSPSSVQKSKAEPEILDYSFDPKVLESADLYDSLSTHLIAHLDEILPDGRKDLTIIYNRYEDTLQPSIPCLIAYRPLRQLIDDQCFAAVKIERDSFISFVIRSTHIPEGRWDVREHLSNHPRRATLRDPSPYVKDTMLGQWQYTIWLDQRATTW